MALTHEDMTAIKNELDERYVKQKYCDERQEKVNSKFANDDKRIEVLSHKFNIWDKLFWVIASASIGSLVTAIMQLILR